MANSRTVNVVKNTSATLVDKLMQIVIQFALRTAFIYILGNEYTGLSGLFTDVLHVLSLMEMGLDSSMIFSLYKPLAQNDTRRIRQLLQFYRTAFTIIGFVVMGAGIACVPFLRYIVKDVPNIKEDIRGIFLMYVATSACSYFLIYRAVLLRANQQSRIISKWNVIVYSVECVVEIVLLLIFKKYYAYLIVHFIAVIARNIIISHITTKKYPHFFDQKEEPMSKRERRTLFRDLACLTMYDVSGVVINSTDSVFISAFVGTVEVAIIGNFTMIITAVRSLVNQSVNAVKPSIGNLAATSSNEKQEQVFKTLNFLTFWIACICCTCLFVLLNPFVGDIWLNSSYVVSNAIIGVMVANFFIAVMVFPVEGFRTANGLFVQGWMRPLIMAALNIALDFFWGRKWGIMGIFVATTVSRLLTQVWFDPWLIFTRVFKTSVLAYYIKYVVYAATTAASCAIAYCLCGMIHVDSGILRFLIYAVISVIIPNLIVLALFGRSDDCHYLFGAVKQLLAKVRRRAR